MVGGVGVMEIRELCRLIFFCSLAVLFLVVDICYVGYVLLHCEVDVSLLQRQSSNTCLHGG